MLYNILLIFFVADIVDSSETNLTPLNVEEYLSECERQGFSLDFCLQNFANSVQPKAKQSLEEYGLPSLGPFEIPKLNLSQNGEGLTVFLQMFNFALHNFSDYQALNWEQGNGKVAVQARFPNVILTTFYELEGTVLNKPIKGRGFLEIDFSPIYLDVTISYETFSKFDVKYCRIIKVDANSTIDDASFNFEGLDKDGVQNDFLNYHSKFLATRCAAAIAEVFKVYFKKQYDNMCITNPSFITQTLFV